MSNWINFSILWMLTGSPVSAALILLAAYAIADWYTFGFLRGVARMVANWRRGSRLQAVLWHNPHDRKARADLGDILVEQHRYEKAIEIVKPLADQDPNDLNALYLLGIACLNTGRYEQGELFLSEAHAANKEIRFGRAKLEIGRSRLKRRDASAVQALSEYLQDHPHNVEGHFLLAQAHRRAGNAAQEASERERCWREYQTSLPYQRRQDRIWAWRARPSRPMLYGAIGCALVVLLATAFKQTRAGGQQHFAVDVRASVRPEQ